MYAFLREKTSQKRTTFSERERLRSHEKHLRFLATCPAYAVVDDPGCFQRYEAVQTYQRGKEAGVNFGSTLHLLLWKAQRLGPALRFARRSLLEHRSEFCSKVAYPLHRRLRRICYRPEPVLGAVRLPVRMRFR